MSSECIAVLTFKSLEHIMKAGGTCSWALNQKQARQIPYVVCMRNAHHENVEGDEPHGTAFVVGRIAEVVPATPEIDPHPKARGRWLIKFSEYAELELPEAWKGWRNPVRYTTLEELRIYPEGLQFKAMPVSSPPMAPADSADDEPFRLTIAQAKQGLASTFGVSPEAVEITIRG